ncbi:MAG: amino acid ABC transporter substrate-binding protein [Candidatus Accumulibacter sp.]|uniref:amino acid ABC transporter substrate-binding protein n=1 Tax=Accumulibacter sp. TaxID=2053492 RepID=UPI001A3BBBEB|nr:amino acid ABC transporter substrate-binding protein [Accumulibacter sp.]MBL8394836.1 amino acid ABC transporter substrate-binding protein [Accumulibacter sp.]
MIRRTLLLAGLAASFLIAIPAAAAESVLATVKKTGTLKLGYRENSIPFSFVGDDKQPRGYSVDLCRIVAEDIGKQLSLPKLDVRWVPVTAQNRFAALKSGEIDLECGNTTQTLSRRADFDFSLMTYIDGASLLFREGEAPSSVDAIKGLRVAVVAGTTTEKTLDELIKAGKLDVQAIRLPDHDAALAALKDKSANAYAADRTVLISTALVRGQGQGFTLADLQFSYEPYGLAMRRDADFRLAVDRTLARLYRTGEISPILKRWFEPLGKPGDALQVMFLINGLPQ